MGGLKRYEFIFESEAYARTFVKHIWHIYLLNNLKPTLKYLCDIYRTLGLDYDECEEYTKEELNLKVFLPDIDLSRLTHAIKLDMTICDYISDADPNYTITFMLDPVSGYLKLKE